LKHEDIYFNTIDNHHGSVGSRNKVDLSKTQALKNKT
jgi:hypothetical protein